MKKYIGVALGIVIGIGLDKTVFTLIFLFIILGIVFLATYILHIIYLNIKTNINRVHFLYAFSLLCLAAFITSVSILKLQINKSQPDAEKNNITFK